MYAQRHNYLKDYYLKDINTIVKLIIHSPVGKLV